MKVIICASGSGGLERDALRRSSNSPRCFAAATIDDVEGHQALVTQGLRDVARDDALGEAFDDSGLTDAGFTDQDGLFFVHGDRTLDDATNLVVAPNDRIELAFAHLGQRSRPYLDRASNDPSGSGEVSVRTQLGERLRRDSAVAPPAVRIRPPRYRTLAQSGERVLGQKCTGLPRSRHLIS